jgi:hypothetical protein
MNAQKPVAKFQAGTVTAAVWENQFEINGKQLKGLRTSIERRFKSKDGQWRSSSSFSRNDIPLAIYCLQRAFNYTVKQNYTNKVNTNE